MSISKALLAGFPDIGKKVQDVEDKYKENLKDYPFEIDKSRYMPDDIYSSFKDWYETLDPDYAYKVAKDLDINTMYGVPEGSYYQVAGNTLIKRYENDNKEKLKKVVDFINETSDKINSLKSEYDKTSEESKKYELSTMINTLYKELETSGARNLLTTNIVLDNPKVMNKLDSIDKYIKNVDVEKDKKALDDYNARINAQNEYNAQKENEPTNNTTPIENPSQNQSSTVTDDSTKIDEWGKPVVEGNVNPEDERAKALEELNNGLKNGLSNISISMGNDGNPVINGRVGYTYDDAKLGIEDLKNVINERLNEALIPFLQSSSFTTRQKIDALETFFMNNPNYTNADLYNIVKFKDNLFNDINTIVSSNISDDEKISRMNDLATQYEMWAGANKNIFPFSLSDMWNDFQIDKDLTSRGLLKLAVDTTVDGQELSKALDMYLSNKSIYDDAIKNYENMVSSYTPDKLESLGQEYGDIASKYNAQKVDKQITNTATGLGQGGAIATQLGNEAQYQNYAENLAENQMTQTDNVTNYAQNKLDNEYAKVQNAYNNAMQAENAVMGEVDKNQADINAYLTKKGVDLATDKYNYERKMQPVQVATNVASSAANAVDKIKNN